MVFIINLENEQSKSPASAFTFFPHELINRGTKTPNRDLNASYSKILMHNAHIYEGCFEYVVDKSKQEHSKIVIYVELFKGLFSNVDANRFISISDELVKIKY